jgi:glycosyltransferase involved in cell wall biosynthesis
MKLLILTQKVDKEDSYFAFFHDWLIRFSRECEQVIVISLEVGAYDLPHNVRVISLGKEQGRSRFKYITQLFYALTKYRNEYDAVFAHMSPWYAILSFPWVKLFNKKLALWYVHRSVDFKLRAAHVLVDKVFTATPESFRIPSRKVEYMGQSVPLDRFARQLNLIQVKPSPMRIGIIGRITPIKNIEVLIKALGMLPHEINAELHIIGAPVAEGDLQYQNTLKSLAASLGVQEKIQWRGPVKNANLPQELQALHASVNLCPPGGLDKAVLESMAARVPVVIGNTAFKKYFVGYEEHIVEHTNAQMVTREIAWIWNGGKQVEGYVDSLYDTVFKLSNLDSMIRTIISKLT